MNTRFLFFDIGFAGRLNDERGGLMVLDMSDEPNADKPKPDPGPDPVPPSDAEVDLEVERAVDGGRAPRDLPPAQGLADMEARVAFLRERLAEVTAAGIDAQREFYARNLREAETRLREYKTMIEGKN
jgi:hypothetical protein